MKNGTEVTTVMKYATTAHVSRGVMLCVMPCLFPGCVNWTTVGRVAEEDGPYLSAFDAAAKSPIKILYGQAPKDSAFIVRAMSPHNGWVTLNDSIRRLPITMAMISLGYGRSVADRRLSSRDSQDSVEVLRFISSKQSVCETSPDSSFERFPLISVIVLEPLTAVISNVSVVGARSTSMADRIYPDVSIPSNLIFLDNLRNPVVFSNTTAGRPIAIIAELGKSGETGNSVRVEFSGPGATRRIERFGHDYAIFEINSNDLDRIDAPIRLEISNGESECLIEATRLPVRGDGTSPCSEALVRSDETRKWVTSTYEWRWVR